MIRSVVMYSALAAIAAGCSTPEEAVRLLDQANAHFENGRYIEAITHYTILIQEYPDLPAAYNNRGVARFRLGDLQGALEDYARCLDLSPQFAEAHCNRGTALLKQMEYDAAIEAFSTAIALKPDYGRALAGRAYARMTKKEYALAVEDYRAALEASAPTWPGRPAAEEELRKAWEAEKAAREASVPAVTPRRP